jgi:homoserine O-succinyltransferase
MPLIVPDDLPTRWMLESEGIAVIDRTAATRQDIRPLRIAVVDPGGAETALARLLGRTPLQVELTVLRPGPADPAAAPDGIARIALDAVAASRAQFDAVVVGHDPEDRREAHEAGWWDELRDFLDWAEVNVPAHLLLGWSARAALHHLYGIPRRPAPPQAAFLVPHRPVRAGSFLLRGGGERFAVPVRRRGAIARADLLDVHSLELLAESHRGEPYLVRSFDRRKVFALHHPEWDGPAAPSSGDDGEPLGDWRAHAALLFANWVNYYVYQPASRAQGAQSAQRAQDGRGAAAPAARDQRRATRSA